MGMMANRPNTTDVKGATQLAILGVACRAPALGTEIVSLVKHIVGRSWQPTSDVIAVNIEDLRERGLLQPEGDGRAWDTTRYAITEEGRRVLDSLLREPLEPSPAGLDPAAVSLKVCFIDLLEPSAQKEQIDAILHLYASEIAHFQEAVRRCACDWAYVPGWMSLEVRRLTAERDWFRELAANLVQASAGQPPPA